MYRRNFLLGSCAASTVLSPWGCGDAGGRELWVSAQGGTPNRFGVGWTEHDGSSQDVPVGLRGHDVLQHPLRPQRIVMIARHPGRELVEIDLVERRVVQRIACKADYEHGGHACFSADGHWVFSAEANFERGEGRIVVRDATDYRQVEEFPSYGVGPHEVVMMPDGRTLAVANGGLRTHPSTGTEVLNPDTMESRLTFIDSESGTLLHEHGVEEPRASIRHIDVNERGELSVALQMQRQSDDPAALAPLAALYDENAGLRVLSGPSALLLHCKDYMGSTRINPKTRIAGFTSPRGDIALFWDLDSGQLVANHRFHDVCGLAVSLDQSTFILSNSAGQLRCLDAITLQERQENRVEVPGFQWDNHLRAIQV